MGFGGAVARASPFITSEITNPFITSEGLILSLRRVSQRSDEIVEN
jgi:hypothetical protein